MVSSQTHGCPEPEVLAAYVDQGLSLAERARVDTHLASCRQCIALVAGVVRTAEDVSEFMPVVDVAVERAARGGQRTLVGVLTAAAAVLVVLAGPSLLRPWLDRDTGLVSLVETVGGDRSVLGRLTGGLPHAPLGAPSAGGQGGRAAEADRIVLTANKIRESFGERETPSRLHALGVQQLLAGRYDEAADSLLAAAREQPNNARYLSDVAAVQLERARLGLRPDDLPRALAAADRARRLDPSLREAWFNRALAITSLSLTEQAKQAWTEYLARDSASPWAAEARVRFEALSQPTPASLWVGIEQRLAGDIDAALADEAVRAQMTEARQFLETELLPAWAAAVAEGRNAGLERERLRVMADAFMRVAGDALYRDAVAAIDRAEARGSEAVNVLAGAHAQYAAAAELFTADRFSDARPGFTTARDAFAAADSPFEIRAAIELGAIAYATGNGGDTLALLATTLPKAEARSYAFSAGRATWFQGLVAFGQGRLGDAQDRYEATLSTFERMGDAEQIAAAHNLLASLFGYFGDELLAWKHRDAALPILTITRSLRLRYGVLVGAASAVRRQDAEAALTFQNAVVETAESWAREGATAESRSLRATIFFNLGRNSEARVELAAARAALQGVQDEAFRRRLEVSILAAESEIFRQEDPARAVAAAARAIELVDERRDRRRLAQLHLRLAQANVVRGRLDAAGTALARGIQAFEDERASLTDEGRLSTIDDSWQLLETSVQLSIKKGEFARAFAMSERSRMRTLAEIRDPTAVRSLSDVQGTLSGDQAVLALSQFDDEVAVWVIRRDRTQVIMRPLTRLDAKRLVSRHQDEIRYEALIPGAGRDLYNEIIRPVSEHLQGVSRLVVVPDETYQDTAFAAFWDASRKHFLVEDVTLTMAPSVNAYAAAAGRGVKGTGDPLILGGPDGNADDSARAVAGTYPSSSLLTGSDATRSRFFADAPGRSVVHLSAKTSANAAYPLLSRVLLADELGRRHSGAMLGREIAARPMPHTSLVVVDAVEAGSTTRGDGTLSLARAFMAAGVPAVLGTLPGADETATRDLMVDFHRRLASKMAAGEALSQTQRNVLHSNGRRLGAWCALVLYGSDR